MIEYFIKVKYISLARMWTFLSFFIQSQQPLMIYTEIYNSICSKNTYRVTPVENAGEKELQYN